MVGFKILIFVFLSISLLFNNAKSENLEEALSNAYVSNPIINSKRAELRSFDEDVSAATSRFFPNIEVIGSYSETNLEYGELSKVKTNPLSGSISANQIIFAGGSLINNRLSAVNKVSAGRENLNYLEQELLYDAAEAYFNYLKSEQIVGLRESNLEVLKERLIATQIQFDVGELTLTDVAQAEARLSLAIATLAEARSRMQGTKANYKSIIGNDPEKLEPYIKKLFIPSSENEALLFALKQNPIIRFTEKSEKSSRYQVASNKGLLSPKISISGEYIYAEEGNFLMNENVDQYQITGTIKIPIFYGGLNWSNIRKAQEINTRDKYLIIDSKRQLKKFVKTTYANYKSSLLKISSTKEQVRANQIALEGVKQEFQLGTRTTLDILDAEQENLDARVALVRAENNSNISMFLLSFYLGNLSPHNLSLKVDPYDPKINYNSVKNTRIGLKRIQVIGNDD